MVELSLRKEARTMKQTEKKNKHLTREDRMEIQECLGKRMSFKDIGRLIEKDPTTISKEVKAHSKTHRNGFTKVDETCPQLLKAPYVCNGCSQRHRAACIYARRIYARRIYTATTAHEEYRTTLRESREGIPLNKEEFYETERTLSAAVRRGQNIYHAILANKLLVSKSTVYRHIARGYYEVARLDLPRAVKFKPRKKHAPDYVPKGIRVDRSFKDFLAFSQENPSVPVVEMDTVIGRPGGKVIMTFHFVLADFMFGILLDNKTAAEAGGRIALLKQKLAKLGFSFGNVFPVLLTDNGGEFSYVGAFENAPDGSVETRVFFCDPNAPYQKPHIENNHTLFRSIAPGGTSFDSFTQETVDCVFSHVNAIKRKQFNGRSAYDMFVFTYSQALADALGISFVDPKAVVQSPLLLSKLVSK